MPPAPAVRDVTVLADGRRLAGTLTCPQSAHGLVLFAHGSGSSRNSPRNRMVAGTLNAAGFATFLFDLLDPAEGDDRRLVFDIGLLARRLLATTDRAAAEPETAALPLGYFGASTGAAAALVAAAQRPEVVRAVVSRGGRPDLARASLPQVRAATLLIVGGDDTPVIPLNESALGSLHGSRRLAVVPGATHLFEEPGALEEVAALAVAWFEEHLARRTSR